MKSKKQLLRIILTAVGAAAVTAAGIFSFYMVWEQAPETAAPEARAQMLEAKETEAVHESEADKIAAESGRQKGVYTVLLVGNDDGNGNTDTIILGKIDTENKKMDFVSIPRDTIINADWEVRKLNAVYWGSKNNGGNGIDALRDHIRKLTGFDVDCYAVIDLSSFVDVIDAMGGVYFDVPQALDYEDAGQELYIHIAPGYQHLDGYQAMGVCRYRSGYADGDLGRIDMQQRFLKACAEQFVDLGNIPNIGKVLDILSEELDTNMSAANIAFFLRQALQCKSEDINFYTAPCIDDIIGGYSYAIIELEPWMQLVNEKLSPYTGTVSADNVDIVYFNGSYYTCTTPLLDPWYFQRNAQVMSTD